MPISDLTGTVWELNSGTPGYISIDYSHTFNVNYNYGNISISGTPVTLTTMYIFTQGYGPTGTEYYYFDLDGTCSGIEDVDTSLITPSEYCNNVWFVTGDGTYATDTIYMYSNNFDAPYSGWTVSNRILTFYGGTDATNSTLINWLYSNATLISEGPTYNKVEFDGHTIIDLSQDTVIQSGVLSGQTYHDSNGASKTGTMSNRGAGGGYISTKAGSITIPSGYYNGTGSVAISSTEQAKIIAGNIKSGVTILGVTGSYSGGATPSYTVTSATTSDVASGKSFYLASDTSTVQLKTGSLEDNRSTYTTAYTTTVGNPSSGTGYVTMRPVFDCIVDGSYGIRETVANVVSAHNFNAASNLQITPNNIKAGCRILGVTGATNVVDTTSSTPAAATQVLSGKRAFVNGSQVTGTMTNNGAVSQTLTASSPSYTIPSGYHNGSGVISAVVYDGSVVTA